MSTPPLPTLLTPPPPDFPATEYKSKPEDFVVEEIPLYEPMGEGTHSYFWLEKRGLSTFDAVRQLAAVLKQRAPDGGTAGLKDAQAVTRQWVSFEHVKAMPPLEALRGERWRVLQVSSHKNKLKMGHLQGNRFILRLRTAESRGLDTVAARARWALSELTRSGIPNFFGEQRFGWGGANAELGKLLVRGDEVGFKAEFVRRYGPRRPADRKLRNLLVNALQSELFNAVLARRLPHVGRLEAGDVAWLHRNGACFAITDADHATREQPRADGGEISPSGPLFGPKMLRAEGRPGEIEAEVLAAAGVTVDDFGRKEAERQPGARRSLRIFLLEPPTVEVDDEGVVLRFALPAGSYATVVLREITGPVVEAPAVTETQDANNSGGESADGG